MSSIENQKISAILIIEVMGRPKEHLVETLEGIIKNIDNEKGVSVIEKRIVEPNELEKQKDLFVTHAEIEIEVDDALILSTLTFKYMPAHITVVEPENIKLPNHGYSDILSEITRRLHKYDEIARVIQMEKGILERRIKELEDASL
jgi:hypothetical protein